ncbi:hypothetical protein [Amycolatopsis sp. 195334CR]|uniref:hypothetical protein n=1 Tax=Amycolatopsis sp. 195334CR TaxID=2814588 RepID=UPI001A906465|nr:hypothetical protein [Amycolatopsis sp. 195334CR]MBN6034077.1 hypothetical protein [Amycolatopsis sp. 195334CR]
MATQYERKLSHFAISKQMREQTGQVRRLAGVIPYWDTTTTDDQVTMTDGHTTFTISGDYRGRIAEYLDRLGRSGGLSLAELIYGCAGEQDPKSPARRKALALLKQMGFESIRPARRHAAVVRGQAPADRRPVDQAEPLARSPGQPRR